MKDLENEMDKKVEVIWNEEGNAKVKPVKGNVGVLEAAKIMSSVTDKFEVEIENESKKL